MRLSRVLRGAYNALLELGCQNLVLRTYSENSFYGGVYLEMSAQSSGTIKRATILIIFIRGFIAGPAVSLYGSPTVSPVIAAL